MARVSRLVSLDMDSGDASKIAEELEPPVRVPFGRLPIWGQVALHTFIALFEFGSLVYNLGAKGITIYRFLTVWGFTTQMVYFLFSAVVSWMHWRDARDAQSGDWSARLIGASDRGLSGDALDSEALRALDEADDALGHGSRGGHAPLMPGPASRSRRHSSGSGRESTREDDVPSSSGAYGGIALGGSTYAEGDLDGLGPAGSFLSPLTRRLMWHRDRYFSLALVLGSFISFGYWCLLFPSPIVRAKFESSAAESALSSIEHGLSFVAIWSDFFLVRHRPMRSYCRDLTLIVSFASAYIIWNFTIFAHWHIWVYPTIQAPLAKNLGLGIPAYIILALLFPCGGWLLRGANLAYWRMVDAGYRACFCRRRDFNCGPPCHASVSSSSSSDTPL